MPPQSVAFQATSQTLLQLMQPGQGFYVPVYQRSYTWGVDQIDRLFEDINDGLNRAARAPGPPTFLGSTILFEGRGSVAPKVNTALPAQVLHVVDGQQRLTTLLLIMGQLRALVDASLSSLGAAGADTPIKLWAVANLQMLASQLTSALWVELPSATGAYRRLPRLIRQASDTWGDKETNAKYVSDIAFYLHGIARTELQGDPAASTAARPHLKLALESIDDHLDRVLAGSKDASMLRDLSFVGDLSTLNRLLPIVPADDNFDPQSLADEERAAVRLAVFGQFMMSHVIVIDVRAPDEDTAFSLFEPLNTTGQPLTPIETLKPLAVTAEGGLDTYVGSRCDAAFQRMAAYAPDELDATERAKRVSGLLTAFALGQDGTKLAHGMLEQRRYLRSAFDAASTLDGKRTVVEGIADTASFLSDVWEDAESPLITTGTSTDRLALEVLRASGHTIVVPLLVRYFERAEQLATTPAKQDFRSVVRAVAAFWTIWRSSRTTTSGVDDVHRGLIKSGLAEVSLRPLARSSTPVEELPTVAELRAALRNLLQSKLAASDASTWSSLVNSQQIYETARVLARYILLCAHDDAIADPARPGHMERGASGSWKTLSLEVWRAHYTVEHIAPQRKRPADTSYSTQLYDEGDVNRLGNLTLLPADLNSLVGNQPWPFKRDVFAMLAQTNQQDRVDALKAGNLYRLGAKSKALLESAEFMPFCKFVADYPGPAIDRAYVADRGKRLAELAWDRLWGDLS
jgi:hypothetical protein